MYALVRWLGPIAGLVILSACEPSSVEQPAGGGHSTQTETQTESAAEAHPAVQLRSAFFGLDNRLSERVERVCPGGSGQDGMPVVLSHTIDPASLQPEDFRVVTRSRDERTPFCVSMYPAEDPGELRTVLLMGEFGDGLDDPPESVHVVGDLLTDGGLASNYRGMQIQVIPLAAGPSLVLAETVHDMDPETETRGTSCPEGTRQVVRVVWSGGVRLPNRDELSDVERQLYQVTVQRDDGSTDEISPFALGDLEDRDNNHLLCLDTEDPALSVSFPAGHLIDPNRDLNPATSVDVSRAERAATDVYFGDMHLHTRYSNDAFTFMTTRTPDDAYRFARGEPLEAVGGGSIRLNAPLDFMAVTDHAESLGVLNSFLDPSHPEPDNEVVQMARSEDPAMRFQAFYEWRKSRLAGGSSLFDSPGAVSSAWQDIVAAADRHYEPGRFTTFAAYEWTASKNMGNLHRNVIFEHTRALPIPLPAENHEPETLWSYMETHRQRGIDSLAIPHNPNVSDGRMFALVDSYGEPLNESYADRRNWNEPLVEVTQQKGTSETHPAISLNDEFADFELFTELLISNGKQGEVHGSYVREAFIDGVRLQAEQGFNPFRFGLIGATDFHSGASSVEENNSTSSPGRMSRASSTASQVLSTPTELRSVAGLTAVWATENTREAIFASLRRREVYATTGSRIRVRFFGGWDYPIDAAGQSDRAAVGYAHGVPMGQTLTGAANRSPRFLVWATRDPNSGNLDRIQIIKGWSENGENREQIYNVAVSDGREVAADGSVAPVGNTVDPLRATYSNDIGQAELSAVWEDPDFDPAHPAVYYVRVLEIPTPRWTTYLAAARGEAPPEGVPVSLQERAYTSPIWYQP